MKKQHNPIKKVNLTKKGESNEKFHIVQEHLERYGYLNLNSCKKGEVCPNTITALIKYQDFFGLSKTGDFDKTTKDKMVESRCGHKDLKSGITFNTVCAWNTNNLTYAFDIHTNDLPNPDGFQAIRSAFQTWQNATNLSFAEVTVNDNPHILIGWRPNNDPDHSMIGGVLAHADFPLGCGVVTNTIPKPIHFDDTEHTWVIGTQAGGFDVETIALHEIGHIIGLAHSNVAGAVMNPTVSSNFIKRDLTQDDIDGANNLYPPKLKFVDDPKMKFFDDPVKMKFQDDPPGGFKKIKDDPKLKFTDDPKIKFTDDPKLKIQDDPGGGFKKIKDDPKFKFHDDPINPKGFDNFPRPSLGINTNFRGDRNRPFILSTPHQVDRYRKDALENEIIHIEAMISELEKSLAAFNQEYEDCKCYYDELTKKYQSLK